tara:strand:+ start:812 stop:1066 length:255 start_codon:yes stop_codon:yes gene_type:complete
MSEMGSYNPPLPLLTRCTRHYICQNCQIFTVKKHYNPTLPGGYNPLCHICNTLSLAPYDFNFRNNKGEPLPERDLEAEELNRWW